MKYFEVLIGREDVTHPKPHEEPILLALEKMCVETKHNVWMIGDTFMDLESASNAEIAGIGVLSGYGEEKELRKYTQLIFQDTYEAVKWIKQK
jgi:phosphoglycolate phosphatase